MSDCRQLQAVGALSFSPVPKKSERAEASRNEKDPKYVLIEQRLKINCVAKERKEFEHTATK